MALRPLISKFLFWLAGGAALGSLVLADPLAPRLATLALGAAACALLVWRGWKPPRAPAQEPVAALPDEGLLLEAAARLARCCATAKDLNDALRGVGHILAHELGAHHLRVARVEALGTDGGVRLKPLLDLAPARLQRTGIAPSAVAGSALRERGVVSDPAAGHAFAVLESGQAVAVIEFESLELALAPPALTRLLDLARNELNDVAQRTSDNPRGYSPARLRHLRDEADAPDFLAAVAQDRQVSLFVIEPQAMRLVALSRRAEREFGLRRQGVLGRTVAQCFGDTIAQAATQALRRAMQENKNIEHEVHWATPRGQRGANVSLCALRHADASPRLLIAMARALHAEPRGGERRVMPPHGMLWDDVAATDRGTTAHPTLPAPRRAGMSD
jgi:PAS domain-containing protein